MSGDLSLKTRWQSVVETLAFAAIAIAIASQAFAPRRIAAQPTAALPQAGPRPKSVELLPTDPISLTGAAIQGDAHAKVAIMEYSDFQCPFCGKFERETLPGLRNKYIGSGQVMLAFRNFPLSIEI
jgi:protein-disulfide isomerase